MYKRLIFSSLACTLLLLGSCKNNNNTDTEAPLGAGMIRMDLTSYGMHATIDIPDTTKRIYKIENLPSGDLHIAIGKGFDLILNVSGETMTRKKQDISGDDVDKFQSWVVQDSNAILYKTQMVNEEFHFYAIVKKGGKTYYAQDLRQGSDGNVNTFNQAQAQAMLDAAKTITPLEATPATKSNPS